MLTCRVLGPTEVATGRGRVDLGGPLPRRLVTALIAAGGRPVGGDALALAVWGDEPPASPEVSLQAYVSRLRRALGAEHRDALQRVGDGYRLTGAETDAAAFEADVARGRELLGEQRPAEAVRAFDAALRLWRGEAFAELADAGAAEAVRARLAELRLVAVEERLAARLAVGDAPGAVAELTPAVRAEPYRERRWELLIVGLYRSARQAEALSALRRVRSMLADELGVDPGPALLSLERRLLAQDPGLLLPTRSGPPPLPAAPAPTVTRPLSSFVGRAAELATLVGAEPSVRLLTLVGPGGAGKTRLAVEYATAHPRGDGPWLVRLADVSGPGLLISAVAAALGVRQPAEPGQVGVLAAAQQPGQVGVLAAAQQPGQAGPIAGSAAHRPGGPDGAWLSAAVADREALLILDNCEHLVAAVAELVVGLLAACPRLRIVATSREPLGVDGERLLPVAPLPPGDAVALLVDRIGAVRPGWRPDADDQVQLGRLAAALDGIPLALELAAARARVLGLGELVTLLGERFPALGRVPRGALAPHATLEAAVAWSVDLLPAGDRALLLRLWPFEGGFTMAAAAAVGSGLEALSSLVTRSVVAADTTVAPTRYRLLGIIRAYCRGARSRAGREPGRARRLGPSAGRADGARAARGTVRARHPGAQPGGAEPARRPRPRPGRGPGCRAAHRGPAGMVLVSRRVRRRGAAPADRRPGRGPRRARDRPGARAGHLRHPAVHRRGRQRRRRVPPAGESPAHRAGEPGRAAAAQPDPLLRGPAPDDARRPRHRGGAGPGIHRGEPADRRAVGRPGRRDGAGRGAHRAR